jgi:hypothetical protein
MRSTIPKESVVADVETLVDDPPHRRPHRADGSPCMQQIVP